MSNNLLSNDLALVTSQSSTDLTPTFFTSGSINSDGTYPANLTNISSTLNPVSTEVISASGPGQAVLTNSPFYIVTTALDNTSRYLTPVLSNNSTIGNLVWSVNPTLWQVAASSSQPIQYNNSYNLVTLINGIPVTYPTQIKFISLNSFCATFPNNSILGCPNYSPFPSPSVSAIPTTTPTLSPPSPTPNRPWWDRLGFWIFLGIVLVTLIVIITLLIIAFHERKST